MAARLRSWWAGVRVPVLLCLGNRLALFALAYFGLALAPGVSHPWRGFPQNLLLDGWFRWDSGWYLRIVKDGYQPIPGDLQQPTNFFPLYPLLVRWLSWVVGDILIAAFVISNAALLLASVWLYRLVARAHGESVAARTLLLLLCYPFSYYLSAMYTESLFLAATVGVFYFAPREQWVAASLCAAAAGATRLVGVVTMVPLVLYYLRARQWNVRRIGWDALALPLGLAGIGAHMIFLWRRWGDPLAFLSSQWVPGWGNEQSWAHFTQMVEAVFTWSRFAAGGYDGVSFVNVLFAVAAVAVCVATARRVGWIPSLWALLTLAVSLRIWRASGRYAGVVWPVFLGVALLTEQRPLLYQGVLTCFTVILSLLCFLFSHGLWVC